MNKIITLLLALALPAIASPISSKVDLKTAQIPKTAFSGTVGISGPDFTYLTVPGDISFIDYGAGTNYAGTITLTGTATHNVAVANSGNLQSATAGGTIYGNVGTVTMYDTSYSGFGTPFYGGNFALTVVGTVSTANLAVTYASTLNLTCSTNGTLTITNFQNFAGVYGAGSLEIDCDATTIIPSGGTWTAVNTSDTINSNAHTASVDACISQWIAGMSSNSVLSIAGGAQAPTLTPSIDVVHVSVAPVNGDNLQYTVNGSAIITLTFDDSINIGSSSWDGNTAGTIGIQGSPSLTAIASVIATDLNTSSYFSGHLTATSSGTTVTSSNNDYWTWPTALSPSPSWSVTHTDGVDNVSVLVNGFGLGSNTVNHN